jgi:pyruvate/2-oxoglutarate dehydrogenase complex dihydrolipoamide dehydrogenase (E3) component
VAGEIEVDICVIGGGAGGLVVAGTAASLRRPTLLVERAAFGGAALRDAVPAQAFIAAARAAEAARRAERFGVTLAAPEIDFAKLQDHLQGAVADLAPHYSAARLAGLGCQIIQAEGRFIGPARLAAGDSIVRARRFVVATGARPVIPAIPGLADAPYFTEETIVALRERPAHLLVLGGGATGVALAQAFRRLGARVTLIEAATILGGEDEEAVVLLRRTLTREGVALVEGVQARAVAREGDGIALTVMRDGREERIAGSHLLLAAGRRPDLAGLELESAGVAFGPEGIRVDHRLRTTNRRIYAIGDAAAVPGQGQRSAHAAAHQARIVVRNAIFRLPARVDSSLVPRIVWSDPALASTGLGEAAARARYGAIRILRGSLAESDRARIDQAPPGLVKAIATRRGRLLGVTILAPDAAELIQPWLLAMARGLKLSALAGLVAPYPSYGELGVSVAGSFALRPRLIDQARIVAAWLARLG